VEAYAFVIIISWETNSYWANIFFAKIFNLPLVDEPAWGTLRLFFVSFRPFDFFLPSAEANAARFLFLRLFVPL